MSAGKPDVNIQDLLAQNPALMEALNARFQGLSGKGSGYLETLPKAIQNRVKALKNINVEHKDLQRKFNLEMLELERKYLALNEPLYSKRSKIVSGEYEPTVEECEFVDSDDEEEEEDKIVDLEKEDDEDFEDVKGIPAFWLTALQSNPDIDNLVEDHDRDCLESLIDVRFEYLTPGSFGFRLIFEFAPNDYFSNTELVKTYHLTDDGTSTELMFEKAEGTEISWKSEDKNLCFTTKTKKQRHKASGQIRMKTTSEPRDSFFGFFSPLPMPTEEEMEENEDDAMAISERLEQDYEMGEIIKDEIIPRAVFWFTGEALEDYSDNEDGEYPSDDEDGGFEDEDDEDEDEDADYDPKKETPEECKQQ
eukprot:CFRG6108T1